MEKQTILLGFKEACQAICRDLRQYEPQAMLLKAISQRLCGDAILCRPGDDGIWARVPGRHKMRRLEGSDLVEFVCRRVSKADLSPSVLAAVCSMVFQTRAHPVLDQQGGERAIRIETGLDRFACHRCGHCCRALVFNDGVDDEDVARWKARGRDDILKWVGSAQDESGRPTYRIWVSPGTHVFAATCPFLITDKGPESKGEQWLCSIHETKPRICRQYPVTRNHALMTGCPGFDR